MLIIGQYLNSCADRRPVRLAADHRGNAASRARGPLRRFRRGEVKRLILSKVGNFAIDLPDANVMVQVCGHLRRRAGGSPAPRPHPPPQGERRAAHFYTLVTRDTREMDFAHHRQLFLTEQGYSYSIVDGSEMATSRREV